jgi:hypothetical protein
MWRYLPLMLTVIALSACTESDQARREREVREFAEEFRRDHFQVNYRDTILPGYRDSVEAVLARHRKRTLDPACDAWLACEDGLPGYYPQMDAIVARLQGQYPLLAARIDSAEDAEQRSSTSTYRAPSGAEQAWEECVRRVVARERDRGASQNEQALAGTMECAELSPNLQEGIRKDRSGY